MASDAALQAAMAAYFAARAKGGYGSQHESFRAAIDAAIAVVDRNPPIDELRVQLATAKQALRDIADGENDVYCAGYAKRALAALEEIASKEAR